MSASVVLLLVVLGTIVVAAEVVFRLFRRQVNREVAAERDLEQRIVALRRERQDRIESDAKAVAADVPEDELRTLLASTLVSERYFASLSFPSKLSELRRKQLDWLTARTSGDQDELLRRGGRGGRETIAGRTP